MKKHANLALRLRSSNVRWKTNNSVDRLQFQQPLILAFWVINCWCDTVQLLRYQIQLCLHLHNIACILNIYIVWLKVNPHDIIMNLYAKSRLTYFTLCRQTSVMIEVHTPVINCALAINCIRTERIDTYCIIYYYFQRFFHHILLKLNNSSNSSNWNML